MGITTLNHLCLAGKLIVTDQHADGEEGKKVRQGEGKYLLPRAD